MAKYYYTQFLLLCLFVCAFWSNLTAQPLPNRYREEVFSTVNTSNNVVFSTNIQTAKVTLDVGGNKVRTDETDLVNTTLRMDIYQPGNFVPAWGSGPDTLRKKPVIVLCFGGGFVTGSRTAWDMVALSNAFAKRGFVVGTIDYRLGMNIFDEDLAVREVYRGIQDGRSAVRYFKANAASLGIDTAHVYIAGYSAGAFIAYHNAFLDKESERPASTYNWSYSCGLFGLSVCNAPNQGCLDCVGDNTSFYGKASLFMGFAGALGFLSNIEGPADIPGVMFHSTDDGTVPYGYGQAFLSGLGFIGSIIGLVVEIPYTHGSGNVKNRMNIVGADGTLYTYSDRDHGPHKWDVDNDGDYDNDQTLYPESYTNASEYAYQKKLKPKSTALSGNVNVCDGTVTETYNTDYSDFYYDWNISGGTFVTPLATRQYSNSVTVQWAPGAGPRTLTVTPYSRQLARGDLLTLNALIPTTPDLAAVEITGATNGCGGLSTTQSMTLKIKNVKCYNIAAGTNISLSINESTTSTSYTENITLPSALNLNDEYTHTFAGTFDMSAANTYNFSASVAIAADDNAANNAANLSVVRTPIPASPSVSNATICFGAATPTFTTVGSNVLWYSDATLATQVGTGLSFTPAVTAAGSYTFYLTQTVSGCVSPAGSFSFIINDLPVVALSSFSPVCVSAAAFALSGGTPAGGTYSGSGVSGGTFNPALAGAGTHGITYTYTDANGCTNSAVQNILVNDLPTVSLSAFSALCIDAAAFALTGGMPAGGTYSGAGVSGGMFNPALAGAGTHGITYTYTDANGCTNSAIQNILVNDLPTVSLSAFSALCIDAAAFALSGGMPAGGTYSGAGVSGGMFDPALAGAGTHGITYTYTDANGCTNSTAQNIEIHALPTVTLGVPTLCAGSAMHTFSGGSPAGGTYLLDGVPATSITPGATASSHTLTYTYTDANGCSRSVSKPLNVNVCVSMSPPPSPSYLIVESIDEYSMKLRFNDAASDEDGYEIYRSENGINYVFYHLTAPYSTAEIVFTDTELEPDKAYFYIVRAKKGSMRSGFTNSAYDYTYPLMPTLVKTYDACLGSIGLVMVKGTHIGNQFHWYVGDILQKDRDGNTYTHDGFTVLNLFAPKTIFVASRGQKYESKNKLAVTVGVRALPEAKIISENTKTCDNFTVLKAVSVAGASYEWIFNDRLYAVTSVPEVNATESGVYRLRIQANGCTNVAAEKIEVKLNYQPLAKILQGRSVNFCQTGILAAKISGVAGTSYQWKDQDGNILGTDVNVNISKTGIYTLEVNENGCINTAQISVNVKSFPEEMSFAHEGQLCEKTSQIVRTETISGVLYEWYHNRKLAKTGRDNFFKFNAIAGENDLKLVLRNEIDLTCARQYNFESLTFATLPKVKIELDGTKINALIDGSFASVKWFLDGVEMPENEGKTSIMPHKVGKYAVRLTTENGCEAGSGTVYFEITSVEGEKPEIAYAIYPNPTSNFVNIRFEKITDAEILIFDAAGKKVAEAFMTSEEIKIDLSRLAAGIYTLDIQANGKRFAEKIVKE